MSSFCDLRDELTCPICLSIYTEPVTLRCGHNFCNSCVHQVLKSQEPSGIHRCPYCRKNFRTRPSLHPNTSLCNIVKCFQSSQKGSIDGIFCTYCITAPASAAKSCLLCEASLCNEHISVHNKSPEHVLVAPTTFPQTRKCLVHSKVLDYFSPEDATCVYCAAHRSHQSQQKARPSESPNLKQMLEKMTVKRNAITSRVQDLLVRRRRVQSTADAYAFNTRAIFLELKKNLSALEMRVLREIWRQEERVVFSIDDNIKQMEVRKSELSKQIASVTEICNFPIPKPEIDGQGYLEDEGTVKEKPILEQKFHVDRFIPILISETFRRDLHDIATNTKSLYLGTEAIDLLLDADTAGEGIAVSEDQKTASWTRIKRKRSRHPEKLRVCHQVLSTQSFSPGKYYWEVEFCDNKVWRIGVTYPKNPVSKIGDNEKSWSLCRYHDEYSVRHDSRKTILSKKVSAPRVGVYLDSRAGNLSFYELGDPIKPLYTFTKAFSEPLYAVLYLGMSGWLRIR